MYPNQTPLGMFLRCRPRRLDHTKSFFRSSISDFLMLYATLRYVGLEISNSSRIAYC